MSFISLAPRARLVPGVGRDSAKIAIVGDYTTPFDDKALTPFSGPNGTVLESCLHAAGLIKSDVYMTNVFKTKTSLPGKNANFDFFNEKKKAFTPLGLEHAEMLRRELEGVNANVIVTCGLPGLMAVSDLVSSAKFRGYVTSTTKLKRNRKLIPTHSPMATIRSNYTYRHMIVADLQKARQECEFPEIVRPDRQLIYDYSSVEEVLQWLDYFTNQPVVCFDIEVINYEVACLSFSSSPEIACVVPIGTTSFRPNGWSESDEMQIWRGIQRVLGNESSIKVVQNGIFDIHFLATRAGIVVRGPVHDTMIGHSVMFPELPKGLDFLGSIYCGSQSYWKDSVKFTNIKGES